VRIQGYPVIPVYVYFEGGVPYSPDTKWYCEACEAVCEYYY
jgi:NAD-dependent dihydropyrimidine dehydrogenase PreA subunit